MANKKNTKATQLTKAKNVKALSKFPTLRDKAYISEILSFIFDTFSKKNHYLCKLKCDFKGL